jgi:hypothetical protein
MPWENVWPHLIQALSPDAGLGDDDLLWLRRNAGSYVVERVDDGRSAYRLYHQALVEYLVEGRDQSTDQYLVTGALLDLVPMLPGGRRDWVQAHPYIREHLSTHAARSWRMDELVIDPGYLLAAGRTSLLAALNSAKSPSARSMADIYRRAARRLQDARGTERAGYLALATVCGATPELLRSMDPIRPVDGWFPAWSMWRPDTPHDRIAAHPHGVIAVQLCTVGGRSVVVTGGDDGVAVWDLATGVLVQFLPVASEGQVLALAVSETGDHPMLVCGDDEGFMETWDITAERRLLRFPVVENGRLVALATARLDGDTVVVAGGDDGRVRLWNLRPESMIERGSSTSFHDGSATAVAIDVVAGRLVVASGGADRTVRLWDASTGNALGDR